MTDCIIMTDPPSKAVEEYEAQLRPGGVRDLPARDDWETGATSG